MAIVITDSMDLALGGVDTTSVSLSLILYMLAKHPEVQDKARKEINSHLPKNSSITYDKTNKLQYITNVIKETLRLHPPVPINGRQATEDTEIGGYQIPKGTPIVLSTLGLQYDNRNWENPEKFLPERFEQNTNPFGWAPFGIGARSCLGQRISMIESKIFLAHLLQNFRIDLISDEPLETSFGFLISIQNPQGSPVMLTRL